MQDKRLDTPAEANREKHINFRDAEDRTSSENGFDDDHSGSSTKEDEERRKQWQQGLEEGRKAAQKNND